MKKLLIAVLRFFSDERKCNDCKRVMKCEYPHYPLNYRVYTCECGKSHIEDDILP